MSRYSLFQRLGARLKQPYTWGSVSQSGDVYLSVWKHDVKTLDGRNVVRVLDYDAPDRHSFPYKEREDHIQMIQSGANCYCVMCVADPVADRLSILWCDESEIHIGGKIIEASNGDLYLELKGTKSL